MSFNFESGVSSPYDPVTSGAMSNSTLDNSGGSGVSGFPTAPQLNPVNISSYNLNGSSVLDSLSGNPFASSSGGPPLTGSNFIPQLASTSSLTSGDINNLIGSISNTGSLSSGGSGAPASAGSFLNSLLGGTSPLQDASLLGLGAYGMSQAQQAQSQTNSEIAPLQSESASLLGESNNLLSQYQSGQLPSWASGVLNPISQQSQNLLSQYNSGQLNPGEQQYANELNSEGSNLIAQYQGGNLPSWASSYVNWTSQEATNLISAQPTQALQQMATQNFTDYTSGKLKPADEVQLNQQVQSQKAQVASQLAASGNIDSSVQAAYNQQIDNQAAITRQSILNSYFTTGDQAYNSWLTSNTDAAQIKAQGAQFANSVFSQMLSAGLNAQEYAAGYTQSGLNSELSAGMQGQQAVAADTGTIMNNTLTGAEQTASEGSQALTQAIGIQLQSDNMLSQTLGSLMQAIATSFAYSAYQNKNNNNSGGSSGGGGSSAGSVMGDVVGGVQTANALYSLGSSIFSAAGGAAAALPAGMSAAVGGGATAAELGTTALPSFTTAGAAGGAAGGSAAASSGAALGAGAGAASALGLAALPLLAGLMTNAVDLPNSYFTNMLSTVQAGKNAGYVMPGQAAQASPAIQELLNNPQNFNNPGPNGAPSYADWMNSLMELQGGSGQTNEGWVQQALNQMGYQELSQMSFAPAGGPNPKFGGGEGTPVWRVVKK